MEIILTLISHTLTETHSNLPGKNRENKLFKRCTTDGLSWNRRSESRSEKRHIQSFMAQSHCMMNEKKSCILKDTPSNFNCNKNLGSRLHFTCPKTNPASAEKLMKRTTRALWRRQEIGSKDSFSRRKRNTNEALKSTNSLWMKPIGFKN